MNPVLFQIGSIEIRWYSIFILLAVFFGYELAKWEASKYEISKDFMFNMTFASIIAGLIGARLYYVIFNFELYSHDILSIFKFWEGGLAIHGGLIFGILTAYIYCKRYNIRFIKVMDIAVVSIILGQAIGRWGNFFNSEAHGPATTMSILKGHKIIPSFVIDGMNINGVYYEPCFYYESLWCILGLIIMLIIRRNKKLKLGTLTSFYLMWYSFGRFIIEGMRTDSLMIGGFKMAQIISVVAFIFGLVMLMIISRKSPFEDLYHETKGSEVKF